MNVGALLVLAVLFSLLMFAIQRTEVRRRLAVTGLMFIAGLVIAIYAGARQLSGELFPALLIALLLNFLFWILIGRYNPVGSSDDIQVIGMDD